MFKPVTPCMPNRLNNQPPITAPTTPRAMSRKNPSPVLLTSLLPMKPAIRPSTIHAMIDMQLLADLRDLFASTSAGKLATTTIIRHLSVLEDQPWADFAQGH